MTSESRSESPTPRTAPWRVVLAVLLVGLLPWSVQSIGGVVLLRFFWGAVSAGGGLVPSAGVSYQPQLFVSVLADYPLFTGPPLLLQWAFSALFWTLALLSALTGFFDVENPRVTAGLLALAAVTNLTVALEFNVQPPRTAYPVGTATLLAAAWWRYQAAETTA